MVCPARALAAARSCAVRIRILPASVPAALPGAIGYLYLPALAIIAAASVTLAPLGARVAHGTDTAKLKRVFALLLFGLAAYMLHTSRSA